MPDATHSTNTLQLTGCAPVPLAHYLKALGIFRLLAEQADPETRGWWHNDVFHLRTRLSIAELRDFFLNTYRSTPIVAPWNGGSGFYPKDNREALNSIVQSSSDRLALYRQTIHGCHDALRQLAITEKAKDQDKQNLLVCCRGQLPDESLIWLDAAFVLTSDGPKYPPLLGTGGNDGRLDFTNNFMQRLMDVLTPDGQPTSSASQWWDEALFKNVCSGLQRGSAIGQFDPGGAGGANSVSGFDGGTVVNPWDFIFMIEGALLFATASARRLQANSPGVLSYPFTVRQVGAGYGSAAAADEKDSRAEMWLPLWNRPCPIGEIAALFAEGRSQVGKRAARNGIDFARALASLGVDRGIEQFQRFGFQPRNGLAYFAIPIGRFTASPQPQVNLLDELDVWLDRFRSQARSDTAPACARRALHAIESAILDLCQHSGTAEVQAVLTALGAAEAVMAKSAKWRTEGFLRPVPPLSPAWLEQLDDRSIEFRLAVSLASLFASEVGPLRHHLEPVSIGARNNREWAAWHESGADATGIVWGGGSLVDNMIAVLMRRITQMIRGGKPSKSTALAYRDESYFPASLEDVVSFIDDDSGDGRIDALLKGLILLDWHQAAYYRLKELSRGEILPDAGYAMLKLCFASCLADGLQVPLKPEIVHRAAAGDLATATRLAVRRLRGSGLSTTSQSVTGSPVHARRIAAALLFPIAGTKRLEQLFLTEQQEPA